MRITDFKIESLTPIRLFEITDLSNIVIIAGVNGSGKTRIKNAIIETFRNPESPKIDLHLTSTREEETVSWGGEKTLQSTIGKQNPKLTLYMKNKSRGVNYVGTVVQIDSSRFVETVTFQPLTLATPDPDDADIDNKYFLSPFTGRWQQLVNKIYQKVANRDNKIAMFCKKNPNSSNQETLDTYPDPFIPYQEVFSKLLPGKELLAIDPKHPSEFRYKIGTSPPLPFNTLSSGEQEVVKVIFDLIWKKIRHCIILIDEPELHLHATLTFRLIETLKSLGDGTNQLFLFTHSPDLISTYYGTGNVFFIDVENASGNQAQRLNQLNVQHEEIARMASANLGVFAAGKKLIFVEGSESSIDRLTYHKLAQQRMPEAYVFPIGSVENIGSLKCVTDELTHAVFGVGMYMVRDRDGLTPAYVASLEENPRIRCLGRRHIENYFLDAEVLSAVANTFYLDSKLADKATIEDALLKIARAALNDALVFSIKEFVRANGSIAKPSVKDVPSKTLNQIEDELVKQITTAAKNQTATSFDEPALRNLINKEKVQLEVSLKNGQWKTVFPGKVVFSSFCGNFWRQDVSQVRQAYVDQALQISPEVFQDIFVILDHFKNLN